MFLAFFVFVLNVEVILSLNQFLEEPFVNSSCAQILFPGVR